MRALALPLFASFTALACAAPSAKVPCAEDQAYAAALVRLCDVDKQLAGRHRKG